MADATRAPAPLVMMPSPESRSGWRAESAFLAATVILTAGAVALVLRLWESDLGVPYVYFFDGLFHGAEVKSVVDHGWHLTNPALGAPSGLEMHDFPMSGENLQFVMIKVLGLFSGNWAVVMNSYFLVGFALVSACAYAVLRQIGFSRWTAMALAVLFSLLPYHFVLGETQLFQSAYFAVPLGAFLVLDAVGWDVWRPPFLARASAGRPRATLLRWAVRAGLVAVVASAGSYYAPFTAVLVAAGSVLAALAGDRRALRRALVVVVGLGAVLAANNVPTLLYQREHGRNAEVANREPGEGALYALRVVDLFLPAQAHRLEPLARVKERLDDHWPVSPVWPTPHAPLGVAGATGLSLSLVAAAAATRPARRLTAGRVRLVQLGILNLVAMLMAVSGGLSSVLTLAGVTQLRVWSRMSVFIGFFALTALGLVVQWTVPRARARATARGLGPVGVRRAGAAVAAVAVSLAVLDQTQPALVPDYAGNRATFVDDRAFVQEIEGRMPTGAAVFQLPIATFPEGPALFRMMDYSLMRGYLHSRDLRWSYAAMRGRPADWAWTLAGRSVEAVLDGATATGFTGLYVDRAGLVDAGRGLEAELERLVGPAAVVSAGLAFWDLRDRAAAQRLRLGPEALARLDRLVRAPVATRWGEGFTPPATAPGDHPPAGPTGQPTAAERPATSPAVLELVNPLPEPRPVSVRFLLRPQGGVIDTVRVAGPGVATVTRVGPGADPVELELILPPGPTRIEISSGAPVFFAGQVVVADAGPGALPA